MKYIHGTTEFHIEEECVLSLGKFDGLHRGHETLLEHMMEQKNKGCATVLFTFAIPPRPGRINEVQKVLTTNEEKVAICEEQGIDYLIEYPFTKEVMTMEPEAFIEMLASSMKIRGIVVGTDFHFGHNRRGDYHLLEIYAKKLHYELKVIDKVQYENRDISSTFIREEVEKGNMEKVKYLLGYDYFVEGVVIHGREMGAKVLGIPTINIIPPENKLLPPFGAYVCDVVVGDKTYHGIADVGCKPTIEGVNPVAVETNIFDFNENLYGKKVRVCFRSRERSEMKFESLEALKQQLEQDIAYGRFYVQQH